MSVTVIRTYKYLVKPSAEQQAILHEMLRTACDLYNHARDHRRKRWQESRHSVTYVEQCRLLTAWRHEGPNDNPLLLLGVAAARGALRRLDRAYKEFVKGQRGYPRFKFYRRYNSLEWNCSGAGIRENRLYILNVGLIPVRWYRPLPDGVLKNVIVKHQNRRWWAYFQVEIEQEQPQPHEGPPVGVDVGLCHALALSDNLVFDSPRYLQESLAKLRRLQRKASRRKKGSNRRRKAYAQVAKLQERIANQRRDWWHKTTRWLVDNYSVIVIEDLNLNFMLRNNHLARAAHDVGLGIFYQQLTYKTIEVGGRVEKVNPAYTSQTCSACGVVERKELSERVHRCHHCGYTADRDVNAAQVILKNGFGDDLQA